jgi:hypothetical protein
MLTKAEMDDIWHNKPVGYFRNTFCKGRKPLNRYLVRVALERVVKTPLIAFEKEVFATTREAAYSMIDCSHIRTHLESHGEKWDGNVTTIKSVIKRA